MDTPAAMRAAARAFLDSTDAPAARAGFADRDRRWLEYRPRARPGVPLTDLDQPARKAAHRLLATALTPHAYAQAMAVRALEEVLDRQEGGRRGRHSEDFAVVVHGDPADDRWSWRFEGHHLSVSMTLDGDTVYPSPIFLGANPALTSYGDIPVLQPLGPEEELGRRLVRELGPAAVVRPVAPGDIYSGPRPDVTGVPSQGVSAPQAAPLAELFLARIPADIRPVVDPDELTFAWEGGLEPGQGHYYRIQGPDLLIEYDNTDNGANHAHSVLRRPHSDFGGGDILALHKRSSP